MLKVITRPVYLLLLLAAPVFAGERPNILILLADDFGYNDSAIYQDVFQQTPVAAMPALEALARDGVRFTRFYTESTCSASRAALLTGQYPARQGFMPVGRGISPDVQTLADYLQQQGYATHHVGKWHVGELNKEAFPTRQGFDSSFGFLSQWMLKGPDGQGNVRLKSPTYQNPWLVDVDSTKTSYDPRLYRGHLEDILTQRTLHLIQTSKEKKKPWFIYHAFFAPHMPMEPDTRFLRAFPHTPDGKYRAMLAQLDENVGKIIAELKKSKQWDNTIIIFASDNGSPEKHNHSNAPFSGGKAEYEEGGIRTPLVIKWQKDLQPVKESSTQQSRSDVVSIMDIYPSIVSVLSGKPVEDNRFDGMASLASENPVYHNQPLYFLTFGGFSVLSRDSHWRLYKQWENSVFTHSTLLQYNKETFPQESGYSFFSKMLGSVKRKNKNLSNHFLDWRDSIRTVPVVFESLNASGAGKITGSDFLRAPINPSFALAFSFTAKTLDKLQTLVSQKNVLDISLDKNALLVNVHGIKLRAEGMEANRCYSVVLSGEFYDRYSALRENVRPSKAHLIVNGKSVDSSEAMIPTFVGLDLVEPTFVGSISKPQFFVTQLLPGDEPIPSRVEEVLEGMCP